MSFEIIETSRDSGLPAELYLFVYGSKPGSHYAYTNAEEAVSFEGITYRPIPIQRGEIVAKGGLDKALLEVRTPKTTEIAEMFRVYPPSHVVTLIIRQGHLNDDTAQWLTCFTGRVVNANREGNEAKIGAEPIHTSMRRTGLREHFQYGCRHVLYGPRCRAPKRLFPARVTAIDGTVLSLAAGWSGALDPRSFTAGLFEYEGVENMEPRTILRVLDATTVLLSGFVRGMEPGATVQLAPGCNHEITDCEHLHGNTPNYGGCKWIPFKNPFGGTLL